MKHEVKITSSNYSKGYSYGYVTENSLSSLKEISKTIDESLYVVGPYGKKFHVDVFEAACLDNRESLFAVSEILFYGNGVIRNEKLAIQIMSEVAYDQGQERDNHALYRLACYDIHQKKYESSLNKLDNLIEKSFLPALAKKGDLLVFQAEFLHRITEGLTLLNKASQEGHYQAKILISKYYRTQSKLAHRFKGKFLHMKALLHMLGLIAANDKSKQSDKLFY